MSNKRHWKTQQLGEYLGSGQFKQGLVQCEKLLKKDGKDVHLHLWKARFLFALGRANEAETLCHEMCNLVPALTDPDALRQLTDLVTAFNKSKGINWTAGPEITQAWQSAIKASNPPLIMCEEWFETCLMQCHWLDAQKAAQQARVAASKDKLKARHFYFAYVAASILAAEMMATSQPALAKSSKELAYRFMAKAVPEEGGADPAQLAVTATQEVNLLIAAYSESGKSKELIDVLNSPRVGLTSPLGQNAPSLVQAKLSNLEKEARWDELWTFCTILLRETIPLQDESKHKQLSAQPRGNGYSVWNSLVTALGNRDMQNAEVRSETDKFVPEWYNLCKSRKPGNRAAWLARLKVLQDHATSKGVEVKQEDGSPPQDLPTVLIEHHGQFGNDPNWYKTISTFLDSMNESQILKLRAEILKRSNSEIQNGNSAAFKEKSIGELSELYMDLRLWSFKNGPNQAEPLRKVISRCIAFFKTPAKDLSQVHPDVVSQIGRIWLFSTFLLLDSNRESESHHTSSGSALILVAILEYLISRSPEDNQLKFVAVLLYSRFGLSRKATENYMHLNVKNAMAPNLNYLLAARISISHPHDLKKPSPNSHRLSRDDRAQWVDRILQSYDHNTRFASEYVATAMKNGHFGEIFPANKSFQTYSNSFSKLALLLEKRRSTRLSRLTYAAVDVQGIPVSISNTRDDRDLQVLETTTTIGHPENLSATPSKTGRVPLNDTMPGSQWLKTLLHLDTAHAHIVNQPAVYCHDNDVIPSVADLEAAKEWSKAEHGFLHPWLAVMALANHAQGKQLNGMLPASETLQVTKAWLDAVPSTLDRITATQGTNIIDVLSNSTFLQTMYLTADLLFIVDDITTYLNEQLKPKPKAAASTKPGTTPTSTQPPFTRADADALKRGTTSAFQALHQRVEACKTALTASDVSKVRALLDGNPVGRQTAELVGDIIVDNCASEILTSAHAALDALALLKRTSLPLR